jgi:protein CpxP
MQSACELLLFSQLRAHNPIHTYRQIASIKEISMFKQCVLIVCCASLIAMAAPFMPAQDSPSNSQQASPSQDDGRWRHGPPDPARRTQELNKQLNLTSDQQTKVQDIFQSERSQMESLRQDTSLSQQDRRAKMMEMHKNTDSQIRAVLDSTQQQKWDEMQAKRAQRMENRRSGAPDAGSDQQGPPPPPPPQ